MHRRSRTATTVSGVAATALLLLATACSSIVGATPGPLAGTQAVIQLCGPVGDDDVLTAMAATWHYASGDPITIDAVTLEGADGIELVTSVLVPSPVSPDGHSAGIGTARGFPPKLEKGMTERWDQRRDAVGGVYPPSPVPLSLFVVLKRLQPDSTTTALSVTYHRGSEEFSMQIPVSYRLLADQNGCTAPSHDADAALSDGP